MNNISDKARLDIEHYIKQIEQDQDITVILAIESGSREWGMPSPNSDYDIRFIYVENPSRRFRAYVRHAEGEQGNTIVTLDHRRSAIGNEVIAHLNIPKEYDFAGWELSKALINLNESNISIVNWIKSKIIYKSMWMFEDMVSTLFDFDTINHYKYMDSNRSVCTVEYKKLWKAVEKDEPEAIKTALYFVHHFGCALECIPYIDKDYIEESVFLSYLHSAGGVKGMLNEVAQMKMELNRLRTDEKQDFTKEQLKEAFKWVSDKYTWLNTAFKWSVMRCEKFGIVYSYELINKRLQTAYENFYGITHF